MYKKDHLDMAALYQKTILQEHFPVMVVGTNDNTSNTNVSAETETNDYETDASEMAIKELESIIKAATHVLGALQNGNSFEPWVASKITLANDYLNTVAQYIGDEDQCDCGDEDEQVFGGDNITFDTGRGTADSTMA